MVLPRLSQRHHSSGRSAESVLLPCGIRGEQLNNCYTQQKESVLFNFLAVHRELLDYCFFAAVTDAIDNGSTTMAKSLQFFFSLLLLSVRYHVK
jgi:hypothetical protein